MNHRRFERFKVRQRWQNARQTSSKHRFATARDAHHEKVMPSCRRNFDGFSRHRLPFDKVHIFGKIFGLLHRLVGGLFLWC